MSFGPKQTLKEGFEKFVIRQDGCWDWKGCCANPGYGQFRHNMKRERAHRASWIIHFGEIPNGMHVLHKCDNRKCSNPEHLFLGSQKDNNLDTISKNRHPFFGKKGSLNHRSVLKEHEVIQIKSMLKSNMLQKNIAKIFNIHPVTVSNINLEKSWKGLL